MTVTNGNLWRNLGDINYMDHYGIFIRQDADGCSQCFEYVHIINLEQVTRDQGYFIEEAYVDISTIPKHLLESIRDYAGLDDDSTIEQWVESAVSYMGVFEFHGSEEYIKTREKAFERLLDFGI